MKLVEFIVRQRAVVVFATVLLVVGGLWSYFRLGKLEDPEFAVKTAVIVTRRPGAGPSVVRDHFGDVYGVVLALTGDGYSYADLKRYADNLQRELLLVDDVSRVELWGEQREVVNVEISRSQLAELKVHPQMILETLQRHNTVVDAGALDVEGERIRLAPTGTFASVDEIGDLVVRGSPTDPMTVGTPSTDLVLLRDVAGINRGYLDPLFNTMAITIMFGLSFATVLTLFVVPVLCAAFFGIRAGDTTVEG